MGGRGVLLDIYGVHSRPTRVVASWMIFCTCFGVWLGVVNIGLAHQLVHQLLFISPVAVVLSFLSREVCSCVGPTICF